MNRQLFFNEVSSYISRTHPDIFLEAVESIAKDNFFKLLLDESIKRGKVADKYGFDERIFIRMDN